MQKLQRPAGSGIGKYFFLIFGVLWTGITCCVTIPIIVGAGGVGFTAGEPLAILSSIGFPLIFAVCFGGIGVVFIVLGLRPIIAGARVSPPDIGISSTNLRSGDDFTLSYQQTFKGAADVTQFSIQLVLRESATYRRGTDTVTVTHDYLIQNFELAEKRFESGETLSQNLRWAIPRGAMHSFEANRNKLRWLIKVKVGMKGWPDYDDEFEIKVLPEMAR